MVTLTAAKGTRLSINPYQSGKDQILEESMRFEKVLVTGSGGLLGNYTVNLLSEFCIVSGLDVLPVQQDIKHSMGSIEDLDVVRQVCEEQ